MQAPLSLTKDRAAEEGERITQEEEKKKDAEEHKKNTKKKKAPWNV